MTKLDSLLLKFTEHLKISGFSERTVDSYTQNVRYFLNFLAELKIDNIAEVERQVIRDYQARLYLLKYRGKPLASATQAQRLTCIRSFYQYLLETGITLHDPTTNLQLPKLTKQLPKGILSKKEIGALLSVPKLTTVRGIRDRAILEVIYTTGIRASELCRLTLNNLDLKNGELRVNKGKGGKDRIVPLGEVACDFLELYLREARSKLDASEQPLLFINQSGRRLTRSYLHCIIKRYAKKAGLPVTGPHALRHTCATHLLKGKADIRQIQELLGHESIATTQRYTKVEITDLKRILKRHHPRERREIETNEQ